MSVRTCQSLFVAISLILVGCGEVTYIYPTKNTKLVAPDPKIQELDGSDGIAWEKKFADAAAKVNKGAYMVSPTAAWQTALLFLNGSEGKTYDQVIANLELKGDRDLNTAATTRMLISQDPKQGVISQGLFFVWPIVPSRVFQYDAASQLSADVVKIGNARKGAQTAMNDWSQMRTGKKLAISFDKDNVFESITLVDLGTLLTWSGAPASLESDVTPVFLEMGFPIAKPGDMDLRPLAIELDNQPVRGRFRQVIRGNLPTHKPGEVFEIRDPKTGQIWLSGRG